MTTYRNSLQNVHLLRILRSVFEMIGSNKSHKSNNKTLESHLSQYDIIWEMSYCER